jgi:hypothetical protein
MMKAKPPLRLFTFLLLVATGPGAADTPADFDLRLRVLPAPNASVQLLELPAAVLASSRGRKFADLRLFDTGGRLLPMALVEAGEALRQDALRPLPILGGVDALRAPGISLRVGADGRAQVLSLNGSLDVAGTVLLGMLLDARQLSGTTTLLLLDAEIPVSQPITFTVEASSDLTTWRHLGQTTAFAPEVSSISVQVPLRALNLHGDWLRVTWSAVPRLVSSVTVRGALLSTRRPPADVLVEANLASSVEGRAWQFGLPFETAVTSIGLMTTQADVIVPYRLLGRADPEQAWLLLGTTVARQPDTGEMPRIVLPRTDLKSFRVEAHGAGAGFTAAPRLQLGLAPHTLVFAAAGPAPYTLAVGRPGASAAFLSPDALRAEQGLVYASVDAPSDWRLAITLEDQRAGFRRQALLWAALVAGTAALAVVAWLLWRGSARASTPRP